MWKVFDIKSLELLRNAVPGSGIRKIIQYLIARGCSKDFHMVLDIERDLCAAGFRDGEVKKFLKNIRSSKKRRDNYFERGGISIELHNTSPSLKKITAMIKIHDIFDSSAITAQLKIEWDRNIEMIKYIANEEPEDQDMFNDCPDVLDRLRKKLAREAEKYFEELHAIYVVWNNLRRLDNTLPNIGHDSEFDIEYWLDIHQDRKDFDLREGIHNLMTSQ